MEKSVTPKTPCALMEPALPHPRQPRFVFYPCSSAFPEGLLKAPPRMQPLAAWPLSRKGRPACPAQLVLLPSLADTPPHGQAAVRSATPWQRTSGLFPVFGSSE